ncbi:MAG: hypothetical protein R3C49_05305 [Planctomycetaceae bacterium]
MLILLVRQELQERQLAVQEQLRLAVQERLRLEEQERQPALKELEELEFPDQLMEQRCRSCRQHIHRK